MTHVFERIRHGSGLRWVGVLAAAWLCIGATPLPDRGTQADQDACTPDVFRLCSDFIPDEPRILTCLQGKVDQLSPACGKVIGPPPKSQRRRRGRADPT